MTAAMVALVRTMITRAVKVIGKGGEYLGQVVSIMTDAGAIVMVMTVSAVTRTVKKETSPGIVRILIRNHPGN